MEHYGNNYVAAVPRSSPLTAGMAPKSFAYEVITHPFPKPFIIRGIQKYFDDSKPDHWLSDYLMEVDKANGNIGNALRYVPLCLTCSARTWLNGLPLNSIHTWSAFKTAFLNNFEGTYQCPGSAYDVHNCIQGDNETARLHLMLGKEEKYPHNGLR